MNRFKLFLVLCVCISSVVSAYGYNKDPDYRRARIKGAQARLVLRVADDEGHPVANASVHVLMGMNYRLKSYDIDGVTDTNGVFVVEGKTTGNEIEITVTKGGYYTSEKRMCFIGMGHEYAVKEGKWQPWGMNVGVVLREVRKQAKLLIFASRSLVIPVTNTWIGVDLARNDFVEPYGHGTDEDLSLNLHWDGRDLGSSKFCTAEISFSNAHDGGYFSRVLNDSKFKYVRCAETNRIDIRSLDLKWSNELRSHFSDPKTGAESELVLRLRTCVDDKGRVRSAHYGAIESVYLSPCWQTNPTIRFVHVFNPNPNDANLEYVE